MWPRQTTVQAVNDQFEHPSRTLMGMEKGGQQELFEFPGALWASEDGKGALATEDADSITLFDASPLGSELSSLPPLDLTHLPLSSLDMSFLDSDMGTISAAGSSSQPLSLGQLDSALEDYTQTWRKLVHESSMLASSFFHLDQPHPEFTFDADPTPPLAFDFDVPAVPATSSEATEAADQHSPATSSVEVVAPKPIRLANPAIHLAALVEDPEEGAASASQGGGSDDNAEESEVAEVTADPHLQFYGYSMEQLREYMSDSESSCDEAESGHVDQEEEEDDTTPNLAPFQFTYPAYHELPNPSTAQYYDTLPPSPFSALEPPASPLSPLISTIPQISRSSQLRETMRERRAARHGHTHGHIGVGHSRHSSVPDIHFRPPGWNEAMHSESLTHIALRRRHRENMSHSVDWSAGVMSYPPSENSQQFEQYSEGYSTDLRTPYPLEERTYQ